MKTTSTIVAVTGHDKPRDRLLARAEAVGRDTASTVILFDRDADLGPLMSPMPTAWSADGAEEEFGNRLDPDHIEAAGQAVLAEQVRGLRAAGVRAFAWLPPKADASALVEYAAEQRAHLVLISADDQDLVDGLHAMSDLQTQVEVVP